MHYIDSGERDPAQALGHWFQRAISADVVDLRWQAGFFTADALGLLAPTLDRLADQSLPTMALVGANEGTTLRDDVATLLTLIRVPRSGARLGVVSFSSSYYHPKTYYLRRSDGSQAAYVGSANLTAKGVTAQHIEAGLIVDTREGDPDAVVSSIGRAIEVWFALQRTGMTEVTGPQVLDQLVLDGVLALTPPTRPVPLPRSPNSGSTQPKPRLGPLLQLPPPPRVSTLAHVRQPPPIAISAANSSASGNPITRKGYPPQFLFDPGAANAGMPTVGAAALSGSQLPNGAVGLIVRLNRDVARIFSGGVGTANISLPLPTAATFLFGIFRGAYERARAEFRLTVRYLHAAGTVTVGTFDTNVMAYGFAPGEKSHRNLRMLVPGDIQVLVPQLRGAALPLPAADDFAFLEWPSASAAEFRLSLLQRGSPLHTKAEQVFGSARAAGLPGGRGACPLPAGLTPSWP